MSPQRQRRPKNRSNDGRSPAVDLLHPAALDLIELMHRAKQMADEKVELCEVLEVMEGIGKASTRLATLLKAEQQLAEGSDLGREVDEAIAELFGHRASLQPAGYDGTEGNKNQPSE